MKLTEIFRRNQATLSFEVFPPKTDSNYAAVEQATMAIAQLQPDFMSVTYGAGGGTSAYTNAIAAKILHQYQVTPLAHLTCVCSDRQMILTHLRDLQAQGIENVLALRGDVPPDREDRSTWHYHHAAELVAEIKANGDFCVGGACYPEGHPESPTVKEDIRYLKEKVDAGCDFLTTQMFFDNNILYNFLYKVREAGIHIPIIPGIMPVTNGKQIKRICELSGTHLPPRFRAIVDRYSGNPAAMKQAGIAYATEQIIDLLANGINAVHVYSMNKPEIAAKIQENLSEIMVEREA